MSQAVPAQALALPRQLTPEAQQVYGEMLEQVSAMPDYLIRPQDWARMALKQANEVLGTAEGASRLAEAKRYIACDDAIRRLSQQVADLRRAALHASKANANSPVA